MGKKLLVGLLMAMVGALVMYERCAEAACPEGRYAIFDHEVVVMDPPSYPGGVFGKKYELVKLYPACEKPYSTERIVSLGGTNTLATACVLLRAATIAQGKAVSQNYDLACTVTVR